MTVCILFQLSSIPGLEDVTVSTPAASDSGGAEASPAAAAAAAAAPAASVQPAVEVLSH